MDIVERLRSLIDDCYQNNREPPRIYVEAADKIEAQNNRLAELQMQINHSMDIRREQEKEIERLRAEIDRLKSIPRRYDPVRL